jgi:hypothetical protein
MVAVFFFQTSVNICRRPHCSSWSLCVFVTNSWIPLCSEIRKWDGHRSRNCRDADIRSIRPVQQLWVHLLQLSDIICLNLIRFITGVFEVVAYFKIYLLDYFNLCEIWYPQQKWPRILLFFRNVTSYSLVGGYKTFERSCSLLYFLLWVWNVGCLYKNTRCHITQSPTSYCDLDRW